MRLLNEIVSVLGDPARRVEYDRTIFRTGNSRPGPLPIAPAGRPGASVWLAALIGMAALVGAGLYLMASAPKATPIRPLMKTEAAVAAPVELPRRSLPAVQPRASKPAIAATAEHSPPEPDLPVLERPLPALEPPLYDTPPRPELKNVPDPITGPQRFPASDISWTGDWFYVPAAKPTPTDSWLYPPIYTQLHLQEESGTISGNYRAIYLVSDRAISGEVRFRVSGRQTQGPVNSLQWVSGSGASGQIELTLRASNLLHIAWWTTRAGDGPPSLGSGSAVLVRQVAR
jgi:hypothetical protein